MVMIPVGRIETILDNHPARDSADYRNARSTVAARLAMTRDSGKLQTLAALKARMEAIGEPTQPAKMGKDESLERARASAEARALGRCKAQILARIESAQFQRVNVSDVKPWLFEAAIQLFEEGKISIGRTREAPNTRGPEPAGGRRMIRSMTVGPADPEWTRPCPWVSRKKQAEDEARI